MDCFTGGLCCAARLLVSIPAPPHAVLRAGIETTDSLGPRGHQIH